MLLSHNKNDWTIAFSYQQMLQDSSASLAVLHLYMLDSEFKNDKSRRKQENKELKMRDKKTAIRTKINKIAC